MSAAQKPNLLVAVSTDLAERMARSLELDRDRWDAQGISVGTIGRRYQRIVVSIDRLLASGSETQRADALETVKTLHTRLAPGGILRFI